MEIENLDAMESGDLRKLTDALQLLVHYGEHTLRARVFREAGNISMAMTMESMADECYRQLPKEYRW